MHRNVLIRYLLPIEAVVVTAIILPIALSGGGNDRVVLLAIWFLAAVALPVGVIYGLGLTTVVTDRRVIARFRPFVTRTIERDAIDSAEPVKYSPIGDCGGWGIKGSRKYGAVLNVAGEHGVFINYTKNGKPKKMLIGSEQPGTIAETIGKPAA